VLISLVVAIFKRPMMFGNPRLKVSLSLSDINKFTIMAIGKELDTPERTFLPGLFGLSGWGDIVQ